MSESQARLSNKLTMPPEFSRRYPDEMNCRLEVTTGSGSTHVAQSVYPKGFPQNPMSDADIEAKFRACCADLEAVRKVTLINQMVRTAKGIT
jgi:2-methylcitrate dehydratase PrpD